MTDVADSTAKIQSEALDQNSPVSEAALQAIGGAVNFLLKKITPVGTVMHSMLDEATFQGQTSTDWVLADGRSVAGSVYQSLTGLSVIPDLRGI